MVSSKNWRAPKKSPKRLVSGILVRQTALIPGGNFADANHLDTGF